MNVRAMFVFLGLVKVLREESGEDVVFVVLFMHADVNFVVVAFGAHGDVGEEGQGGCLVLIVCNHSIGFEYLI